MSSTAPSLDHYLICLRSLNLACLRHDEIWPAPVREPNPLDQGLQTVRASGKGAT